jgi:Raf kinase inhibitor-like YbhB/YbcL family protein
MPTIADLRITSTQFTHGGRLDDRNAYDRDNVPPPLTVTGAPEGTVELAVICHDADAPLPGGWTHWVLYGIPASGGELGAEADKQYRPGPNSWGDLHYNGPRPPDGHGTHFYYFFVYALSRPVDGAPDRVEFLERYADAILEQNRIVGLYER